MFDVWSVFDASASPWLLGETVAGFTCDFEGFPQPADIHPVREEAISHAVYRLIEHRFVNSPGVGLIMDSADSLMTTLGFDATDFSLNYAGGSAAALGNYVADCYIRFGLVDGANETADYANEVYVPVNPPILPEEPGNPDIVDLNRWQPIQLSLSIDHPADDAAINDLAERMS